jgi:hypothetical protein
MIRLNALRGPTSGHFDVSRIMWFLGGVTYLAMGVIHLVRDRIFDPQEFGLGFGLMMAAGGGATLAKDMGVAKAVATGANSPGEAA